jgi:hypothetical protein
VSEEFKVILLSLLLFTIGFVAGNEFTSQKYKDQKQDQLIQYLINQIPNIKELNGL